MKKTEVIQKIFLLQEGQTSEFFIPKQEKGLGYAPVNIALCKYWGKRDTEINLPVTSSLSVSLPDKGALTNLIVNGKNADTITLNGELLKSDSKFVQRTVSFLDLFRPEPKWHVDIDINMNVPVGAGLASSACGYASLTAALNDLFNWQLTQRNLSILARLGSGSACRSLWTGFVEWHVGVQPDGMDSYGEPLPFEWPELCVGILNINESEKPIASREAMQRTQDTSILYANWPRKVMQDLIILKQALHVKNFPLLGGTSESNALTMHATILGSWPPICYFLPETITAMHKVWKLRQEGLAVYFTEDAGPNLKLLFLEADQAAVKESFSKIEVLKVFE